jgi:hypothetical protein
MEARNDPLERKEAASVKSQLRFLEKQYGKEPLVDNIAQAQN